MIKAIKEKFHEETKKESHKAPSTSKKDTTITKSTSDTAEVIVDDEPAKEAENINGTSQENEILVVEDEESEKNTKNGELTTKKVEDSPIDVEVIVTDEKSLSNLDEMVLWLHDSLPLSEEELEDLCITMDDFKTALKSVQPSAKREGFATVPNVTWDDVGSLKDIREELQMSIVVSTF